jgi:hypothetical protein
MNNYNFLYSPETNLESIVLVYLPHTPHDMIDQIQMFPTLGATI